MKGSHTDPMLTCDQCYQIKRWYKDLILEVIFTGEKVSDYIEYRADLPCQSVLLATPVKITYSELVFV